MDPSAVLPDDLLADVLRRLPKRSIAVSSCVCKKWRAVIHTHPVTRAELHPRSLAGILVNFRGLDITELFYPADDDKVGVISGKRDYLPDDTGTPSWSLVRDHCNGLLLLLDGYVLNPATRWWDRLPAEPPVAAPRTGVNAYEAEYLVYDPLVSPHYEVFLVPRFSYRSKCEDLFDWDSFNSAPTFLEQSEWPPSHCVLNVFSSRIGQWEQRAFIREGAAAGTVADMRSDSPRVHRNAVYWQGSLFVHCQTDFVMRLSLSDCKLQVIKPPEDVKKTRHPKLCVGKSHKGVYCALAYKQCRLRVWFLDESTCPMEWVLKNDADLAEWSRHELEPRIQHHEQHKQKNHGPWILQNINRYYHGYDDEDYRMEEDEDYNMEENTEWNLDYDEYNENIGQVTRRRGYIDILGFHPSEEVIFLSDTMERGLAFHFNDSKTVDDLGRLYPTGFDPSGRFIASSFPYTPSWM